MNTKRIREMIVEASRIEAQTSILVNLFTEYMRRCGVPLTEQKTNDFMTFMTAYIAHVPGILDETERVSRECGWWGTVQPMMEAAQQYFFDPNDLIPDHLGMLGLLDDAYLAHALLQSISDQHKAQTGSPLISVDMSAANAFIRTLIGEQAASVLDNYILNMVNGPQMQNVLQQLVAMAGSMNVSLPDRSFGGLSVEEYSNLQADLIITSI